MQKLLGIQCGWCAPRQVETGVAAKAKKQEKPPGRATSTQQSHIMVSTLGSRPGSPPAEQAAAAPGIGGRAIVGPTIAIVAVGIPIPAPSRGSVTVALADLDAALRFP